MIPFNEFRVSEIAKLTGQDKSVISKYFKTTTEGVTRNSNRIVGISPEAVHKYFLHIGQSHFDKGAIILLANLCGGVGKTTGTINFTAGLRRITDRKQPIISVDSDPQASYTKHVFKEVAQNKELLLIDFLQGRASIDDILTPLPNNIWFVKSNFNNEHVSKILDKPQDIKNGMLKFYNAIFNKFGNKAKIIQDHNPSLNVTLASSICAIKQIDSNDIVRALLIPIRSDVIALDGARSVLGEVRSLDETFSLPDSINIHCFFSVIDNRLSTLSAVLENAADDKTFVKYLSDVSIRFSDDIHKSIANNTNVYTKSPSSKAAEDYNELVNFVFSYKGKANHGST